MENPENNHNKKGGMLVDKVFGFVYVVTRDTSNFADQRFDRQPRVSQLGADDR